MTNCDASRTVQLRANSVKLTRRGIPRHYRQAQVSASVHVRAVGGLRDKLTTDRGKTVQSPLNTRIDAVSGEFSVRTTLTCGQSRE